MITQEELEAAPKLDERAFTYTLADAIREGSQSTVQARGAWGEDGYACALTAAYIAAKKRGWVK